MVLFFRIFGSMDSNQNLFSSMVFCQFWTANDVTLSLSLFLFFSVNSLCVLNIPCCRGGGLCPTVLAQKVRSKKTILPLTKNKKQTFVCLLYNLSVCVCVRAHTLPLHNNYTYIFSHNHIYISNT